MVAFQAPTSYGALPCIHIDAIGPDLTRPLSLICIPNMKPLLHRFLRALLILFFAPGVHAQFTVLHSFGASNNDGETPTGSLTLSGSTLYGTTTWGVAYGVVGTIFKINTDGSGYAVVIPFDTLDLGLYPAGDLLMSGTVLFGTTCSGGSADDGTVFKVNTDGTGYSALHSFLGEPTDGSSLYGSLLLSGSTLFGMTSAGGSSGSSDYGTVFGVNVDGTGYFVLHNLAGALDGQDPVGSLVASGSTLYGMTEGAGGGYYGTIFKINTDGTGYSVLHNFEPSADSPDGSWPKGSLLLIGSTLYGMTSGGGLLPDGSPGCGIIFKINTDGTGYTILYTFTGGTDGNLPAGSLIASGSTLYGTTEYGGANDAGVVFQVNLDGSGFQTLHSFDGGAGGSEPCASLTLSGSTVYGTTSSGGAHDLGVVFSLVLTGQPGQVPPAITTQPTSQTAVDGSDATFTAAASGTPAPTLQWQVSTDGGNSWTDLADSDPYSGVSTGTLTITGAMTAMNGWQYHCVASNGVSPDATSDAAVLTVNPLVPVIEWFAPPAITYGTALSSAQLNATANVPGTFVYAPAAGTVLGAGTQTLSVTFTPTDTADYATATAAQTLTVVPADYQVFLQDLFPLVLGRQIDSGAQSAFTVAMTAGATRAQIYADLIASPEFQAWQVEPVIRLYFAAFNRIPDYAGLQNWSAALHAGSLSLTDAANGFATSAEFLQTYGALDNTGFVEQLYLNVLGREADTGGLNDWVGLLNGGASRGAVLIGFSESDEFKADSAAGVEVIRLYYLVEQQTPTPDQLQGWLGFLKGYAQTDTLYALAYPSGIDNAAYIQAVFSGFLRRDADAGALNSFGAAMTAGAVTHASLVDAIMSSDEFNQDVSPVARLYLSALLRVPDQPGLDAWVNYISAGNTLQSMADLFASSTEFTNRYGAMDNTAYVTALYQNILGRQPDTDGLNAWVGELDKGTATRSQVLIGFAQSQEAIALFAPTMRTFLHYFAFFNMAPPQTQLDYWTTYLTTLDGQMRESFLDDVGPSS